MGASSCGPGEMESQHDWPPHPQPIPSLAQRGFSHPKPIPRRSQGVPSLQLPVLISGALVCSGGLWDKMGAGRTGAAQLGGTRMQDCMDRIGDRKMGSKLSKSCLEAELEGMWVLGSFLQAQSLTSHALIEALVPQLPSGPCMHVSQHKPPGDSSSKGIYRVRWTELHPHSHTASSPPW